MLRFMADEYDDTASTVFPFLQTVLTSVRNSDIMLHALWPKLHAVQARTKNSIRTSRGVQKDVLDFTLESDPPEAEVGREL